MPRQIKDLTHENRKNIITDSLSDFLSSIQLIVVADLDPDSIQTGVSLLLDSESNTHFSLCHKWAVSHCNRIMFPRCYIKHLKKN